MDFETWEPVYETILAEFGYSRESDELARDELAALLDPYAFDRDRLAEFEGERVVVAGGGPSLDAGIDRIEANNAVIGASVAVDGLLEAGIDVDLMVTDLDKNPRTAERLAEAGTPVAVHAHGDNRTLLADVVPGLPEANVVPTTQAAPRKGVENVGGFTDGDRAAFLADHAGAREITFIGWDFDDGTVDTAKERKLGWAERLLYWLETRRNERFGVLDGRRSRIEVRGVPVEQS